RGELLVAEAQQAAHARRYFRIKALVRVARAERGDFDGLRAEQITRGIDAVDADVPDGAAAQLGLRADVFSLHLVQEIGAEEARLADAAGLDRLHRFQIGRLEV